MADYGIAIDDTQDLDRAYTEEKFRRAKDLADGIFERWPAQDVEELCTILFDLGIHLDRTYDLNITGGEG